MKLGTWCSQSGSPFLNLILQNWKTLSHLHLWRDLHAARGVYSVHWPHSLAMGWWMRAGSLPHCLFWLVPLSGLLSPWLWGMVSKAAWNGWELALGSRLRDMINSYRKKPCSYSPFVSWTPEGCGRRHTILIFTPDFWDLPISWSNNQAKTIPMYICPKKTNFKTFLERRNYTSPFSIPQMSLYP